MRTFFSPYTDAARNLALEEFLLSRFAGEQTRLLYRNAPALVCGKYQNLYAEVNLPLALSRGVGFFRRATGGGTVYHDEGNLNYTILTASPSLGASYDAPLEAVLRILHDLGIPARRERTSDLFLFGKKISGSAERVSHGALLHHGTLLYDADLAALQDLLTARGQYLSRAIPSVRSEVGNIRALSALPWSKDEFAARFAAAFFDGGALLSLSPADEEEISRAAALLRNPEHALAPSPAFTLKTTLRTSGEAVSLRVARATILSGEGIPPAWVGERLLPGTRAFEELL